MPQAGPVAGAVRDAINATDAKVSVSTIASIEEQMAPLIAEERIIARLGIVFGSVALSLAAVGLYGVLSYGVARRSGEMAIRLAVGAQPRDVIVLILRESTALVLAGLALGGVAAYLASRIIASRLHGVAPQDPLTLTPAATVLLLVSLIAAYIPARRASRVDPIAALQQG